ncbi:MAG: hypothetical protein HY305_01890 [Sphingobacteriales bacterium]|nr:hypothetical protein [Sphingobacteriales bacterium]
MKKKIIAGDSEEMIWQKVAADLNQDTLPMEYHRVLYQDVRKIMLDIDVDLGGGFESGDESTSLTAVIPQINNFRFALYHEAFIDKLYKMLGMEDVVIGYPEFDKQLIVKTNDAIKAKAIFIDTNVRQVFQSLHNFTLHIVHRHINGKPEKQDMLEFTIDRGILNPIKLRRIYHAFVSVLTSIDAIAGANNKVIYSA